LQQWGSCQSDGESLEVALERGSAVYSIYLLLNVHQGTASEDDLKTAQLMMSVTSGNKICDIVTVQKWEKLSSEPDAENSCETGKIFQCLCLAVFTQYVMRFTFLQKIYLRLCRKHFFQGVLVSIELQCV